MHWFVIEWKWVFSKTGRLFGIKYDNERVSLEVLAEKWFIDSDSGRQTCGCCGVFSSLNIKQPLFVELKKLPNVSPLL